MKINKSSNSLLTFAMMSLIGLVTSPPVALGCGFHASMPEVQLGGMYKGALSVAVAVRKATDNGIIDSKALEGNDGSEARYNASMRSLQELGNAISASPVTAELPESFSLGFVESSLWSRYTKVNGKISVDIHTDGPQHSETVVLTTEPVLAALLAGKLSAERALADGLIRIEGVKTDQTAIRHAFMETSTTDRLNRT
jgi:hypothetical protein